MKKLFISKQDAKHLASELRRATKNKIKQQKRIDRGLGACSDELEEHRYLGYLEGKETHLKYALSLLKEVTA